MTNQHGGPRAGAERKPGVPLAGAANRTRRIILLSDSEYRTARSLGGGNASAGVRRALDTAVDTAPNAYEYATLGVILSQLEAGDPAGARQMLVTRMRRFMPGEIPDALLDATAPEGGEVSASEGNQTHLGDE